MDKHLFRKQSVSWQIRPPLKRRGAYPFALGVLLLASLIPGVGHFLPAHAAGLSGIGSSTGSQIDLELEGRLEPRQFAQLTVSQPARIDQLLIEEGDQVKAGSVLLRLDGYEGLKAELSAAELEKVLAEQARDDLYRHAEINLAQATLAQRQAEKDRSLAEDLLASIQKPHNPQVIEQAHANLLLAEERLAKIQEDYRKAESKFDNRKNPIWMFVSRHKFKLLLNQMGKAVAYYERRYWDAREKYDDLIAPPDAVDLALAEASLAEAQARLRQAEREIDKWRNGPDPAALESAQAGLQAAEARLTSARTAALNAELSAPVSGNVVSINAKPGEWATPGQTLVSIADLSQWNVVTQDLGEDDVSKLKVGLPVDLTVDAYPETALHGVVESISLYSEEEDGDVYYQAKIAVQESPDFLRWGMTTRINLADN